MRGPRRDGRPTTAGDDGARMQARANLVLLLVSACWGAAFPSAKFALDAMDPSAFVVARFLLATLLLLPFSWRALRDRRALVGGFVLGSLDSGIYLLQCLGIDNMQASRCAFLAGFAVVFVPLLAFLVHRSPLGRRDAACIFSSMFGLYWLTDCSLTGLSLADAQVLASAALFAVEVLYLQRVTTACSATALVFYQILFTCLGATVHGMATGNPWTVQWPGAPIMAALLFCVLVATVLAANLQIRYQARTSALHAAIIYSLQPVFAACAGILVYDEVLTWRVAAGGGLIVLAGVVASATTVALPSDRNRLQPLAGT
jgi:drug/metabolite transporter (DMT)-like permease